MQITKNEHFLIIDDLLSIENFNYLNHFLQSLDYEYVHSQKLTKAFGLNNNPLWSTPYISQKRENDPDTPSFPTGLTIDLFLGRILKLQAEIKPYVGNLQINWDFFFCRPYLYPRETCLDWHTDGKYNISGAYTYFAHKNWKPSWGGELLIDSKQVETVDYPQKAIGKTEVVRPGFALDNSEITKFVESPGQGYFIYPKPNRLIVMKNKLWHKISPVSSNAGENYRMSLSGFFMNNDKIAKIKKHTNSRHSR